MVVSPCTSARAGGWASSSASMPSSSRAVSPASCWPGRITSSSASTERPNRSITCCSISRCWPVETTRAERSGWSLIARDHRGHLDGLGPGAKKAGDRGGLKHGRCVVAERRESRAATQPGSRRSRAAAKRRGSVVGSGGCAAASLRSDPDRAAIRLSHASGVSSSRFASRMPTTCIGRPKRSMKPRAAVMSYPSIAKLASFLVVQRLGALAADGQAAALVELDPDLAGDDLGCLVHESLQRLAERVEPLAVVDDLRVAAGQPDLLVEEVALQRQLLEALVRLVEDRATGRLVHAA